GGGFSTGSVALKADSVHLAADIGFTAAPLVSRWAIRRFGDRVSFNRRKIQAGIAFAGGAGLSPSPFGAARPLFSPVMVPGGLTMLFALAGLVSNSFAAWLLREHTHESDIKAVFTHFVADVVGSIIIIASGAALFLTHWLWLDPLANIAIITVLV